jgi:trehalose 6-phosphate synthase
MEEGTITSKMLDPTTIVGRKRKSKVAVFPISIDYDEFSDAAGSKAVVQRCREIKEGYHGQKIILGVDRLDYSKGIPQRLKAYRTLLKRNPQLHTKVKLIQVMVPSREDIIEYGNLKREIEQLVGEINGKFSQAGWIPIQNCYYPLKREELLAYYRASDIALVTPLKDGMNLVAKEYCVANVDREGVLILSRFAGVRQQFKDNALVVNPFDEESVVDALKKALFMESEEKHKRMERMQENVRKFDIYWWVDAFLQAGKREE